jgi:hypothetical protein
MQRAWQDSSYRRSAIYESITTVILYDTVLERWTLISMTLNSWWIIPYTATRTTSFKSCLID